jgi:hypothetical protein
VPPFTGVPAEELEELLEGPEEPPQALSIKSNTVRAEKDAISKRDLGFLSIVSS